MKEKLLITGGLGNLGSWLTQYFVEKGNFEVTVLTKNLRNLEWDINYNLIQCDISDIVSCREALDGKQFDYVLHTASVNDVFVDGYSEMAIDVNVKGTRNLLEVLKSIDLKNFVYFSTFHVYGKSSGTIDETTPVNPKNDYGATHLFAEYYVKQFHANHGIPFTNIRLSNSYGCPKDYDSSKWYLILNDLSRMVFEKQQIVLNGDGLASRDFIWMGDVCKIMESILSQKAQNTTFNLSSERSYQLLEIAQAVQQAYLEYSGKSIEVSTNPANKTLNTTPVAISATKLKSLVNYDAKPHFKNQALEIFQFLEKRS